jgi:pilus assembly protein CpaE
MKMECWVVGDCQHATERIRNALARLKLVCPETHVLTLAAARRSSDLADSEESVVFVAMPVVSDMDIDAIRYIRSSSHARLVVVSSVEDKTTVVNAIRAGATDFLDEAQDLFTEIAQSLSRISLASSDDKVKPLTISIVPCHVASDSSILATNLAAAIAQKYGSCCLLDFQLRGGDLALLLKLQPAHSVYDLINHQQTVDEGIFRQALAVHESGIHLLAGPPLFSDLRGIDSNACNEVVNIAQTMFSHVVIATEDIQHSEQIYALAHSDQALLTLRPDLLSLHRAKQHIDFMLAHNINSDRIQVAVMGTGSAGELPMSSIKKVLNRTTAYGIPEDASATTLSINVGNPVILEIPKSQVARGIMKLAGSLTGQESDSTIGRASAQFGAKAAALLALNTLSFCK